MLGAISTLDLPVGYHMLSAASRFGNAVSDEAVTLEKSSSEVVQRVASSIALFGHKSEAISQIYSLVTECAKAGWDGENAKPIDLMAAISAIEFVWAMPDGLPLPEFAPEPDGALSLDWIQSSNRVLSVSVRDSNRLAYAWIDGSDRGHGVARFTGEKVPLRILQGIADVIGNEDAAFWAA